MEINPKTILVAASIVIAVIVLSFLSYLSPILNVAMFIACLAGFIYIANKSFGWALAIMIGEMVFGGDGYAFMLPVGKFAISLRIAFFVAIILIWLFKKPRFELFRSKLKFPAFALIIILLIGLGIGLFSGYPKSIVYADFNGFLFLLILLPIFDMLREKESLRRITNVLIGATLGFTIIVVAVGGYFYYTQKVHPDFEALIKERMESMTEEPEFSQTTLALTNKYFKREPHSFPELIYRWGKDRGVFDIAYAGGDFSRVNGKSQIFNVAAFAALIILLGRLRPKERPKEFWLLTITLAFTIGSLLFSFSRSLWIGAGVALILSLFFIPKKKAIISALILICLAVAGLGGLYLKSPTAFDALSSRATSIVNPSEEYAASTRLNILEPLHEGIKSKPILGHGFGSTLTFFSESPENYGLVEKYMTEWGYQDLAFDIGILGLIVYIWFWLAILIRGFRAGKDEWPEFARWSLVAAIAVLAVNITTPYLNHPLGMIILLLPALPIAILKSQNLNRKS